MLARSRLPAAARPELARDERVLAWATTSTGGYVVATNLGLWWPGQSPRRILWHLLDKVVWSEAGFEITEAEVDDELLLIDRAPVRVELAEPRKLPAVVRRRVEASVARTEQVMLSDGSARVVGRKVAGQDGLSWWVRLDPGTPDTAIVRAEAAAVVEPLRAETAARLAGL